MEQLNNTTLMEQLKNTTLMEQLKNTTLMEQLKHQSVRTVRNKKTNTNLSEQFKTQNKTYNRVETVYPFRAPEFIPCFSWVRVTRSLVLYVCFVDRCLSFCTFSFGHCVFCSFSIYGF